MIKFKSHSEWADAVKQNPEIANQEVEINNIRFNTATIEFNSNGDRKAILIRIHSKENVPGFDIPYSFGVGFEYKIVK